MKNTNIFFSLLLTIFVMVSTGFVAADDYSDLFGKTGSSGDTGLNGSNNDDAKNSKTSNNSTDMKHEFKLFGESSFNFYIPVIPDHQVLEGNIRRIDFDNEIGLSYEFIKSNISLIYLVSNWNIAIKLDSKGFSTDNIEVVPLENYIGFNLWKFNIKAGYIYHQWGTADKINPSDMLNPRDFSTGVDADKMSVLSLVTSFEPVDQFKVEVVYVPFYQESAFPVDFKDNVPQALFYGMSNDSTSDPFDIPGTVIHAKNIDEKNYKFDLSRPVIGAKLNFRVPKTEFSFGYIYDFDQYYTPTITMARDLFNIPLAGPYALYRIEKMTLERKRVHRINADFKTVIDDFGFWLEGSYMMTEDYDLSSYKIRNHKLSFVTGFDYRFGPDRDFYFNIQYLGEFIPGFDTGFYSDYKDGLPENSKTHDKSYMEKYYYRAITDQMGLYQAGFEQGLAIFAEFPFYAGPVKLKPSFSAVYTIPLLYDYSHEERYGSLYLNTEFAVEPFESLKIVVGANLFFSWVKYKQVDQYMKQIVNDGSENNDYIDSIIQNEKDKIGIFKNDAGIYLAISYKWDIMLVK